MTVWQWLTKKLPLEDKRDVMARVGVRFLWCTGPYFLLAFILSALDINVMLSPALAVVILSIPIIGGVADWCRLKRRLQRAPGAAA
jgi:hypothetical protein